MTIDELAQHCKRQLSLPISSIHTREKHALVLSLISLIDKLRLENENIRQHSIAHSTMKILINDAVKDTTKALELAISAKHKICGECPSSVFASLPDELKCDLHCETWAGFENWCCWTTPTECWKRYFLAKAKELNREVANDVDRC